jgi:heptosyltransferase-2
MLQALRERFPDAEISLLAKPHAEELLRNSGLVDHFIDFDFPWTATTGKYRPSRYDRRAIAALVRHLRQENFDLTIDCRMDSRSNVVTFVSGAPRRIGYDFGGGSYLLTDALPAAPDEHHKVHDWLALLEPLDDGRWGGPATATNLSRRFKPELRVTPEERREAARQLRSLGFAEGDVIVAIHPGASQPQRRWPLADFAWVADSLSLTHSTKSLVFLDPESYGKSMPLKSDARFIAASLRELMALLTNCDLFIGNDSGPMHVADALGVPVVGIFTTGNPVWHRPFGEGQVVVGQGTGHACLSYPTRADVLKAAESQLNRRDSMHVGARLPAGAAER